jgi:hypothetical protein
MSVRRFLRFRGFALALLALALGLGLQSCGKDKKPGPPGPRGPQLTQVQTAAELETALIEAVAGDTIQVLPGLSGGEFRMAHGFTLKATQSPLLLIGDERSPVRPRIVFPDTANGLVIRGHTRVGGRETTIENLDFDGGRNTLLLDNARSKVCSVCRSLSARIRSGSDGTVELCYFEANGAFAVSTHGGSRLTARRNTVLLAGDCGFYIDSNAVLTANNIVQAHTYGIILQSGATAADVRCNNAWQSGSGTNYVSSSGFDFEGSKNYELNPQFCGPGLRSIKSGSPLAALNSDGCGTIGSFEIGCD